MVKSKKGLLAEGMLVNTVLKIAAFIAVASVLGFILLRANDKSAEEICRGSLGIQEATRTGIIVKDVSTPLACRTVKKEIPEEGRPTPESVKESFANLIDRCWWMFGEGRVRDVFKSSVFQNNCFVCYEATVKEGDEFKLGKDKVSAEEMKVYVALTPKEVKQPDDQCYFGKGECIPEDKDCGEWEGQEFPYLAKEVRGKCPKKDGKKQKCCIGVSDCTNKGGKCASSCKNDPEGYLIEMSGSGYSCPDQQVCCVRRDNFVSHLDYVQDQEGDGAVVFKSDIEPGETYSIGFLSTGSSGCSGCGAFAIGGAGVGVVLCFASGICEIAISATAVGATALAAVGGGLAAVGVDVVSEKEIIPAIKSIFSQPYKNIIVVDKAENMKNQCSIVQDATGG